MNPCVPGVSLRKGCLIIGIVQIIVGAAQALLYTLGLYVLVSQSNVGGLEESQVKEAEEYFAIPFVNFDSSEQYKTREEISSLLIIVFGVALGGAIFYIFVGCLLVYATQKGSVMLLKCWGVIQFSIFICGLIYIVVILSLDSISLLGLSLDFLVNCLQAYFCWVGYALIVRLREEQSLSLSSSVRKNGEIIDIAFPMDAFTKF